MSARHSVSLGCAVLLLLLTLCCRAGAHEDGQEFTYMSMFLRPEANQPKGGDDNLEQIYRQFSVHDQLPQPRKTSRRQLHANTEDDDDREQDAGMDAMDENDLSDQAPTEHDPPNDVEPDSNAEDAPALHVAVQRPHEDGGDSQSDSEESGEQIARRFGEDLPRLMKMLKKLIAQYDIKSMADVPCRAHSHWMPQMLESIAEENENFKYVCIDTNALILNAVKERVGLTVESKYVKRKFWKEGLPNVDLVFSWAGLDNMKEGNVLRYLQKLSQSGKKHKLVMLGNHAGSLAKKGDMEKIARFTAEGKPLNFRRKPFNLVKPMRMIRDLGVDGNDKQLYLYKPWEMFPKRK